MKSTTSTVITLPEARTALLKSGYLLESRVEKVLQENQYYVEANTVYPDPITQKSREVDLQATKYHHYKGKLGNWVTSTLFIECINNPQPIAFITKENPNKHYLLENIKLNGLPKSVKFVASRPSKHTNQEPWISIEDHLNMQEYHHYCVNKVATQFCSFIQKKSSNEWMAHHDDIHFEAFQKLSDITSYFLTKTEDDWRSDSLKSVNLHFFYPVVVLQGIMLDVKVNKKRGVNSRKTQHLQFIRTTIQNNEPTAYQIDVVIESYFPKYLKLIENEMLITMDRIKENLDTINTAATEIANKPLISFI